MAYNNYNKKNQQTFNANFYNPYAFVPLNERVYFLSEEERKLLENVQDVPFENGYSGRIDLKLKAVTPFCVKIEANNGNDSFYTIPGSSIKGMIRSVFEIITMSNFRNGVRDDRYSFRDLGKNSNYALKSGNEQKSGILIKLNEKYYIHPCESEKKSYFDIAEDEELNITDISSGTVEQKYSKLESPAIVYDDGTAQIYLFSGHMNGKEHEFLLDIPILDKDKLIPLEGKRLNDFLFIHEKENENASWKYWKKRMKNYKDISEIRKDWYEGVAPCFFRTYKDENGKKCVLDLGFAYLYRQAYDKSIHDFIPTCYKEEGKGIDLAQSVFGYTKGDEALKGRVQFGSVVLENPKFSSEQCFILGTPKPTFYPFYIEQEEGQLKDYFTGTKLSGYKRYLVHNTQQIGILDNKNKNVVTRFKPVVAGTEFVVPIYFHNLRDYELGALLAAISFCNKENQCFHSLGFAKPYGYGKMKIQDIKLSSDKDVEREELYQAYINKICSECKFANEATMLSSISNLFILASNHSDKEIRYPKLKPNEFVDIKKAKLSINNLSPKK
jgi:CRISPR-associated protein (TIGR03986 family)